MRSGLLITPSGLMKIETYTGGEKDEQILEESDIEDGEDHELDEEGPTCLVCLRVDSKCVVCHKKVCDICSPDGEEMSKRHCVD